jgi:fatty acid desaturase
MTKERLATVTAAIGGGLLFATAGLHFSVYSTVMGQTPADLHSLLAALWVAVGASLIIAALLAVAATPLFIVRRRALLGITALIPLSIAVVQIVYLAFLPPTGLLLLDALVLAAAGALGRDYQPRPMPDV